MQKVQGVADRLTRHAELVRKLVLPDAMARWQRTVGDPVEDTRIDLIDQVRGRLKWDHLVIRFWNTEFRTRKNYP